MRNQKKEKNIAVKSAIDQNLTNGGDEGVSVAVRPSVLNKKKGKSLPGRKEKFNFLTSVTTITPNNVVLSKLKPFPDESRA